MTKSKWSDLFKMKPPDLAERINTSNRSLLLNAPKNLIEHHVCASQEIDQRIAQREKLSIVFRRLPHGTTCGSIIRDALSCETTDGQFTPHFVREAKASRAVDRVTRDSLDPRRFVITFSDEDHKSFFQKRYVKIGDTLIKPSIGDFHGYIPDTPYFLDTLDFQEILSKYGVVETIKFNTIPENGIRTNGLHFSLTLKDGCKVPDVINFEGTPILIVNKDSRKQCTFCRNYGHLAYQCQKRKRKQLSDLEAQAVRELMEDTTGSKPLPTNIQNPPSATLPRPTPPKRDNPENGHDDTTSKRSAVNHGLQNQIGPRPNIFADTSMDLDVSSSDNENKHDS